MDDTSGEQGRYEEALKAALEAVESHRALAQRDPDAFQRNLISSLDDLCVRLSRLGRYEEALKAAAEAVELSWAQVQSSRPQPDSHRYQEYMQECMDLVMSRLFTLDTLLRGLGRLDEALTAAPEAVEPPRALAQRNPDAVLLGLAGNLQHLAHCVNEMQIPDVAASAAWQAVIFFLAAFQPGSAGRLGNLGSISNKLWRFSHEERQMVVPEAVEFWRALAQRNPDAFHPGLADSFTLLMMWLHGDELSLVQAVVEIRRILAQRDPETFLPSLASSLDTLGFRLQWTGRHEEALTVAVELVELSRALAQPYSDTTQLDLVSSLLNLGGILIELGRFEEALAPLQEALDTLWPFLANFFEHFWKLAEALLSQLQRIHSSLEWPLPVALQERGAALERLKKSGRVLLS